MNKTDLIKNNYLFRDIAANDLSALATIAEEKDLNAGNLIYDAGQDSDAIFIIEMGTVDIIPKVNRSPSRRWEAARASANWLFFIPINASLRP